MTAASMESCRFAARRSPRGRFWSVVDVRKRLQRVRHPFHQSIHIKQGAQPANQLEPKSSMFWIQSSLESPKNRRMRPRRLLDLRPPVQNTPHGAFKFNLNGLGFSISRGNLSRMTMPRVKDTVTQFEPELRNIARKSSISSYIALLRARPPSHPAEASLRDRTPAPSPALIRRRPEC